MLFALGGIFLVVIVVVLSLSTWPRLGSVPRNLLRWTRIPLIAFAVLAVGPSARGLILHVLYLAGAHFIPFIGPLERPPRLDLILGAPLALTVGLWPFLTLYGITLNKLIQGRSTWRSVRMAMIVSVAAMSLPSTFLLVAQLQEFMSSAPDAGQGAGILCAWCSCRYRPWLDGFSVAACLAALLAAAFTASSVIRKGGIRFSVRSRHGA
jgi:hypothetical protein